MWRLSHVFLVNQVPLPSAYHPFPSRSHPGVPRGHTQVSLGPTLADCHLQDRVRIAEYAGWGDQMGPPMEFRSIRPESGLAFLCPPPFEAFSSFWMPNTPMLPPLSKGWAHGGVGHGKGLGVLGMPRLRDPLIWTRLFHAHPPPTLLAPFDAHSWFALPMGWGHGVVGHAKAWGGWAC